MRGLLGRLDLDTLAPVETGHLDANDIGIVRFATAGPLVVDAYAANRFTGSFVLIDEATNATLGAAWCASLPEFRARKPFTALSKAAEAAFAASVSLLLIASFIESSASFMVCQSAGSLALIVSW